MSNSFAEHRVAISRFSHEAYELHLEKALKLMDEIEAAMGQLPEYLAIRWEILRTVFYDDEKESVPDDYPVLILSPSLIMRRELWTMRRSPYCIVIDRNNTYLMDEARNHFLAGNVINVVRKALYSSYAP